ncbi:hypothetical protein IMZ48_39275 [Candidatus Bathyarchaeota archaeon]|nr:hypothetical protein [Candidatus Bathyarchaeota archaeon]
MIWFVVAYTPKDVRGQGSQLVQHRVAGPEYKGDATNPGVTNLSICAAAGAENSERVLGEANAGEDVFLGDLEQLLLEGYLGGREDMRVDIVAEFLGEPE